MIERGENILMPCFCCYFPNNKALDYKPTHGAHQKSAGIVRNNGLRVARFSMSEKIKRYQREYRAHWEGNRNYSQFFKC
ncbi:hypothetical protein A35_06255 [Coxiella burnetii 'MSU Goat Q177']|nr:hypothetical protein A35_06255 [Coxiella burnetii 'MSU Goat Q177']